MNDAWGKNAKDNLDLFFDISIDLMAVIGEDERFKKVSKEWEETLGWSEEELLSTTWVNIIHKDDIKITREFLNSKDFITGKKRLENRYLCKDGQYKWLEWSTKYIDEQSVFLCTARDITDRRIREAERLEYERNIQSESMKSEFFANISHEFKTPLNIILATMQLMNKNIEEKNIIAIDEINLNKYMNSIKQNCYRILRLVNNIIDTSKIDNGYFNINLSNHNIVSIVEDITMSVIEYANGKGIKFIFDTEEEEIIIACDPDKIERIILNLLSNAIKYTEDNGTIKVNINSKDDKVIISIIDDGIGIPSEKLNNIFDRYMQIDNQVTRVCNGSGIGLSLVKSLIELQDGKIYVESKIGEGTEFTIEFPKRKLENDNEFSMGNDLVTTRIEKCNIEFADIYK